MNIENNNGNGIVNLNGYIFWSKAEIVKPYIMKYLKDTFINALIIYEFNKIDIVILGENIPVEIQSKNVRLNQRNSYQLSHAEFEDRIRRQIEDNITNYSKCWFFFDSEYFRYLQNSTLNKNTSIDMSWFVKYIKEEKLKVFTIKYNGLVKELTIDDFNFLEEIHSNDEICLDTNKLKIYKNVLKGYNFTQKEIDDYYEERDKLSFDKGLLKWKDMTEKEIKESLEKAEKILNKVKEENWSKQNLENALLPEAEKEGDRGRLLWPLRVALTGKEASASPFEVAEVLGKERTLKRIKEAVKSIK